MGPQLLRIVILCLFLSNYCLAQTVIDIPYGNSVTVDGQLGQMEWADADTLYIESGANDVKVLYKHDSTQLMVAYYGPLESANISFPEIMIDSENDKSDSWAMDDWWFHVSATDCENQGAPEDYSNCEGTRPNWTARPNMQPGGTATDTIEIAIPFSTLGSELQTGDTIGLSFQLANLRTGRKFWPQTASLNNPSTWATAIFQAEISTSAGYQHLPPLPFSIYPNPLTSQVLYVQFEDQIESGDLSVQIFDCNGRKVMHEPLNEAQIKLELDLPKGVYTLFCTDGIKAGIRQLIVQ